MRINLSFRSLHTFGSILWRIHPMNIILACVCVLSLVSGRSVVSDPLDYSLPGSSVHGVFQARILEWVAISFSKGSSWPRDLTQNSCHYRRGILYLVSHGGSLIITATNYYGALASCWAPIAFHPHNLLMLSVFGVCSALSFWREGWVKVLLLSPIAVWSQQG